MGYKTIIGLEIHAELMTRSKMFCDCTNEFGGDVNTHCCPVCLGLPGALPRLNEMVVEYGMKAGLAFHSDINQKTKMDRKNYFYSDLTKGYQTSQEDLPLCSNGYIEIEDGDESKKIRLERIHIEEDTGKSVHTETDDTLLDYNRAGVPLIEIVSKPDMNSAEEARLFLEKLRNTLKYLNVSDVKMEEGSLRCDINVNVMDEETGETTNITEIKNLNSFRAAVRSIEYEEKRHREILAKGENTEKDTRRWDEVSGETIVMRDKGTASDYRFAVDGDIPPIEISDEWVKRVKDSLPELPHEKRDRFISDYNISKYDAEVLTQSQDLANFFEEVIEYKNNPELVSNWVMGDLLRRLNDEDIKVEELSFKAKDFADLLDLVEGGEISNNVGKDVFREMFETGKKPKEIVEEEGLTQISDESELENIIKEVLDENPQSIEDFKAGRDRALGYLMGQVMKKTKGQANPQKANEMIRSELEKR